MHALVVGGAGTDIADALEAEGVDVTRLEGVVSGDRLEDAGVADADLLVVADSNEATAVPVAHEHNPDIRTVAYTGDGVPEFIKGVLDLTVDPALLDATAVAEELAA
ncbi:MULTISPECIES: DUF7126 family protein [Halobacterium]|uniref:CTP synthetase n=4 Tax=Halobacterium salinarum TaxID=2242 RepID=Q9HP34_HALSA|nr:MULTISPECIES: hypothetical protein [Halobacterium]AAG20036.1 hypothetical protein VNG_1827H [Halobacterium salinarum NRC-1]MBB6089046.1 Trk K+ transport system NAD-binding subunit [Halobacterium salinarum]MCF2164733.1 CTP synthetase [Halobacterium salinarum]MCF2167588.1 CTP synthetase [Halobacterium salinarum]MCF2207073.1 CTP synthetase [Halobacterium salinarum]